MKVLKNRFIFTLFLLIVNIFFALDVFALTNPYKQTGPYGINCTWYAWKMAFEKAGVVLPGFGNAKNWYRDAQNAGYTVGTDPRANSIIVWGDWTSYGHVGYVERVEGNILYVWDSTGPCIDEEDPEYIECMANGVSEESDRACKANAKRIACEYTISPSTYTITGYIYLDYAPKKTTSSSSSETTNKEEIKKSSNANLSNIELSVGSIEFAKKVLKYSLDVENEIDKITISATTEDKKATIKGTGNYKLNVGLNELKIIVTAEDGSTKEYNVEVTRNEKIEVEENLDVNDTDENSKEVTNENNNQQTWLIVVGISSVMILVICSIFIIRKHHSKK